MRKKNLWAVAGGLISITGLLSFRFHFLKELETIGYLFVIIGIIIIIIWAFKNESHSHLPENERDKLRIHDSISSESIQDKVKRLLEASKADRAISLLLEHLQNLKKIELERLENLKEIENMVITISGRLVDLNDRHILGKLTDNEFSAEKTKIIASILKILNYIDE